MFTNAQEECKMGRDADPLHFSYKSKVVPVKAGAIGLN